MKYADGPTSEQSIDIEASSAAVWALISDPGFPVAHSSELQEAAWDADGPIPGIGARILGRNQHDAIGEWSTTSFVVDWVEGERLSWAVMDPANPAAQWWFELQDRDGLTRLTQRVRLGPGPSGLTPAIERMPDREDEIVRRRLEFHAGNMLANLEAAKRILEAAD